MTSKCAISFLLACLLPQALLAEANLSFESLEASDAFIGSVTIENNNIFDLENPDEDKSFYRFLNRAHVKTRPGVISQQLLFDAGDAFSAQTLEESERILRANRYIQDAQIVPVKNENGVVDINVTTSDVWTLMPKLSYSRSGGKSKSKVGLSELNLFGSGVQLEALYSSDVDRDSILFKVVDGHIGDSWYGIKAIYEDSDDGQQVFLDIGKPFHSLDSKMAQGILLDDFDRVDSLYDRGKKVAEFQHHSQNYELHRGWSKGLDSGWARRFLVGLGYKQHEFSAVADSMEALQLLPENRKFVYPFVGIELVQDKFVETSNIDQIARTEDQFMGTSAYAQLGLVSESFGSDRDAWLLKAGVRTSFGGLEKATLRLSSDFSGRWESAGARNLSLLLGARYYKRQSAKRTFFASVSGSYGKSLDMDQQFFLGGDTGLRGYPLRFQTGDKVALLTIEQRYFTDWYPFRLFRVGGAIFFDAGRTWGDSVFGTANDGLLKDIGFGLRLGNARSGLGNMAHIDLAYPLDGDGDISNVQLLISVKQGF